jgi:uncharacterized protein YcbX
MILSEINVYPVKSLGGISLKTAVVESRGLQFDRRWMLTDEKNQFLTQRDFPTMATTASVKIWSSRCRARIYEKKVNEWFSDVLETNCRLVLMPEETIRRVNYFYAVHKDDAGSFADGYPFLLSGENSLADLNSRLDAPIPMNRFRPNLVVSDSGAFAEDEWKKIKIGACVFHVVKPCARCVITTIDQSDGIKTGAEPLKTLAAYRIPKRSLKKKILFGQYLIAEGAGAVLNVGDKIEVIETKNRPKF